MGTAAAAAPPVARAATFTVNRIGDASDLNLANSVCDTSTNAGNQCTLRAAIQEANDSAGPDTINFQIKSTATTKIIAPSSPLPRITGTLTINGYSQGGASTNTQDVGNDAVLKIVLDGVNAGADVVGLDIQANNSVVRGLVIMRWGGAGINILGSGNSIRGNIIGTNAAGNAARPNFHGITVSGPQNTVGGTAPAARNLISGNAVHGVVICCLEATDNDVQGNYIGTRKGGGVALGNGGDGVQINSAFGNTVGGTDAGAGNVISGNGDEGVEILGVDSDGGFSARVVGNFVGTSAAGTADLGNGGFGVSVAGSDSVLIGGSTAAARNVISGNGQSGIQLACIACEVYGNHIGTNAAGDAALGNTGHGLGILARDNVVGGPAPGEGNVISANGGHGVMISNGTNITGNRVQGNRIGIAATSDTDLGNLGSGVNVHGPGNDIGGPASGQGNVVIGNAGNGIRVAGGFSAGNTIAGNTVAQNDLQGIRIEFGPQTVGPGNIVAENGDNGVRVSPTAPGVRITANQILNNGALGINLSGGTQNAFGVTSNDVDDPDTGAGNLQNFPVITSAVRQTTVITTVVSGTLNSTPSTQFRIELYTATVDASGHGEGSILRATGNFTTNSGGDVGWVLSSPTIAAGQRVTTIAINTATGDTSEFSLNRTVSTP
jgi:CSLREA domain-containing protein